MRQLYKKEKIEIIGKGTSLKKNVLQCTCLSIFSNISAVTAEL